MFSCTQVASQGCLRLFQATALRDSILKAFRFLDFYTLLIVRVENFIQEGVAMLWRILEVLELCVRAFRKGSSDMHKTSLSRLPLRGLCSNTGTSQSRRFLRFF